MSHILPVLCLTAKGYISPTRLASGGKGWHEQGHVCSQVCHVLLVLTAPRQGGAAGDGARLVLLQQQHSVKMSVTEQYFFHGEKIPC